MKKILFIIATVALFSSCTEQERARMYGGNTTINVPAGYKVTSATWKENDIFYFIEPMEADYTPKEKVFVESSSWGVLESKVTFVETR
jgi:hypothetical protein